MPDPLRKTISERREFEMTRADLDALLDATRPTPTRPLQFIRPSANRAWERLGERMGFDPMTVMPSTKGRPFFTAVPTKKGDGDANTLREVGTIDA